MLLINLFLYLQVNIIQVVVLITLCVYFCSWQNDVFVVAEPGELADNFLQSVKLSLLSVMRNRRKKAGASFANISTVSDLVACRPYFQLGGIVHRYMGRQTQVCSLIKYSSFWYFIEVAKLLILVLLNDVIFLRLWKMAKKLGRICFVELFPLFI
jgi:hypothetical protein